MDTISTYQRYITGTGSVSAAAVNTAGLRVLILSLTGISALLLIALIQTINVLTISIPIVILSIIVSIITGLILNLIIS